MSIQVYLNHGSQDFTREGSGALKKFIFAQWKKLRALSNNTLLISILVLLSGCREQIVQQLSEPEANRLMTKLHQAKISARKVKQADGFFALEAENGDSLQAIQYLSDARLLRERDPVIESKTPILSTREDQRFHYERSLSHEIETTLLTIDGVYEARVHLNLPAVDPIMGELTGSKENASGSVLLITSDRILLEKEEVAALVAGAAGIKDESISVHLTRTPTRGYEPNRPNATAMERADLSSAFKAIVARRPEVISVLALFLIGVGAVWLNSMRVKGCKFEP